MRHGKKFNHLGRTASHRGAMLSNMASSLILHKRINTTVAKAKALRKYVEPLITKAKTDTTHSRRMAFSYLQDKETVQELFSTVAEKVASRPGGYVRIIKTGNRLGDSAEMCMMELVDFNELLLSEASAKPKTRRSRRGGGNAKSQEADAKANVEDAQVVEEVKEEKIEETKAEVKTDEAATDNKPEAKSEEAKAEEKVEDTPKVEAKAEEKEEEKEQDEQKEEGDDKTEKKD